MLVSLRIREWLGAISSVGRASRLHRENTHKITASLSIRLRTERDSKPNKARFADHFRTTLQKQNSPMQRANAVTGPKQAIKGGSNA